MAMAKSFILTFLMLESVICDDFSLRYSQPKSEPLVKQTLGHSDEAFRKYERLLMDESPLLSFDADESVGGFLDEFLPTDNSNQLSINSYANVDPARLRSTGTTIAGICGTNFVVLGADTRATNGPMVADKRCDKIHELADNIFACGAGTSADLEHLTRQVLYQNKLQSVVDGSIGNQAGGSTRNVQNVAQVCENIRFSLYRQGGHCSANLVVGGVFQDKAILRAIHPHGSQDALSFTALGSGGLAAMAVLEQGYFQAITIEEAKDLVARAISAGIKNDLGSGSQVDLCVITNEGTEKIRCYIPEDELDELVPPSMTNSNESSRRGVNGFGNHPFVLRGIGTVGSPSEVQRKKVVEKWRSLLSENF